MWEFGDFAKIWLSRDCEVGLRGWGYEILVNVRLNSAKAQVELARTDSEDSQSEWGEKVN